MVAEEPDDAAENDTETVEEKEKEGTNQIALVSETERDARKKQGVTVTQFLNTQGRVDRQNQATVAKKPGVHS